MTNSGGKEPGKGEQLYPNHEHVYRCQDCGEIAAPQPEPPQGEQRQEYVSISREALALLNEGANVTVIAGGMQITLVRGGE